MTKPLQYITIALFALTSTPICAQKEQKFSMIEFASYFIRGSQWNVVYNKSVDSLFVVLKTEGGQPVEGGFMGTIKYTFKDNTYLTLDYDSTGNILFLDYYYNHQNKRGRNAWESISWERPDKPPYHMKGNWHVGVTIMAKQ
jgi:hypothetical protein